MKIHTSLDYPTMYGLLRDSGAPINFHSIEKVGSRTHDFGYHVHLTGTGSRSNSGSHGAADHNGATWDEWGAFFGALFDKDPEARCGGTVANPAYRNASHFHYLTGHRFQKRSDYGTYLPADTHKRHQWDGGWMSGFECKNCSAERPPFISGADWS
jgi:hypothetical protein